MRVVLDRQAGLRFGPDAHREDHAGRQRIGLLRIERRDLVEIEEGLDVGRPDPGFLLDFAQRGEWDRLVWIEAAGDALPEAREDPPRRAADEQDLGPPVADSEDPALDDVRSGRHRRRA